MTPIPTHAWLTRKEASEFCKQRGHNVESTSLATMASTGVGPPYSQLNKRCCLYKRSDLERWVQERLSARRKAAASETSGPAPRNRTAKPQTHSHTEQPAT